MSVTIAITKLIIPTLQLVYALYRGKPEAFIDAASDLSGNTAEVLAILTSKDGKETKFVRARVSEAHEKILTQIESYLQSESIAKQSLEIAASESIITLAEGFSVQSLLENYSAPESLAKLWNKKRKIPLDLTDNELTLHNKILEATANSLLRNLDSLPWLRQAFFEFLIREVKQAKDVSESARNLLNVTELNDLAYLFYYRKEVIRELNKVELFLQDTDIDEASRSQELSVAYINLEILQGANDEESRVVALKADDLLDHLVKPKRAVVLGTAGCGKTTFLKWIAIEAAGIANNSLHKSTNKTNLHNGKDSLSPASWRDKIPFYVPLRDCTPGRFPQLFEFHSFCATREPPAGWCQRVLDAGRGILLFDGLDELKPIDRDKAIKWILDLSRDMSVDIPIVISSRPQAVTSLKPLLGFNAYTITDLKRGDKIEFVERWHEAVRQKIAGDREREFELNRKKRRLLSAINSTDRTVSSLAVNPLICALLCALNRVYERSLPESLKDLCEQAVKMLLTRDFDRGVNVREVEFIYSEMFIETKIIICRDLAYNCVKSGGNRISYQSALRDVSTTLYGSVSENLHRAEEVLEAIILRSGIIRKCGRDEIEFLHSSLRDFLASLAFVNRSEHLFLLEKVFRDDFSRWEPVVLFASANSINEHFGKNILSELFRLLASGKLRGEFGRILALKIAAVIRFPIPKEIIEQRDAIRDSFLPINVNSAYLLKDAGQSAVALLSYKAERSTLVATACVYSLRAIGGESATLSLLEYLEKDSRPAVLNELAKEFSLNTISKFVNPLLVPSLITVLGSVSSEFEDDRGIINDLSPLSRKTDLTVLDLHGISAVDIGPLRNLVMLRVLSLADSKIRDLEPLVNLKSLEELDLSGTRVDNYELLSSLDGLVRLKLDGCLIGSAKFVPELKNLRFLSARNSVFELPSSVSNLMMISVLDFCGSSISSLESISSMVSLVSLNLAKVQLVKFDSLKNVNLEVLDVSETDFHLLSDLKVLENLKDLNLNSTKIKSLHGIGRFSKLETLTLDNTSVFDLTPLEDLRNLRELSIDSTEVKSIRPLRRCKSLVFIDARNSPVEDLELLSSDASIRLQI